MNEDKRLFLHGTIIIPPNTYTNKIKKYALLKDLVSLKFDRKYYIYRIEYDVNETPDISIKVGKTYIVTEFTRKLNTSRNFRHGQSMYDVIINKQTKIIDV